MVKVRSILLLAIAASFGLTACAPKAGGLMNLRASGSGPDEFTILPTKPLTQPKSYSELPAPTPGGTNAVEPTPRQDAVAALGGNPKYMTRSGIPRSDQGMISAAARYGVSSDIRGVLAQEDLEFRGKHRGKLLERVFGNTVYFSAYRKQTLDRYAELRRLRRLGIRTPAAPPKGE